MVPIGKLPDRGRGTNQGNGVRKLSWSHVAGRTGVFCGALLASATAARAQEVFLPSSNALDPSRLLTAALVAGAAVAVIALIWLLFAERRRLSDTALEVRRRAAELKADNERLATLADARDRRIVFWDDEAADDRPTLFGDLPAETGAPPDRAMFLAFGRWMQPHSAGLIEHALRGLRTEGTPFDLTVETLSGTPLEVEGRTGGAGRFVRFHVAHGSRRKETDLRARVERSGAMIERYEALLGELVHPAWTRDRDGRLDWTNMAYARLVDHASGTDAAEAQAELFGESARATIRADASDNGTYKGKLSTVIGGARRVLRVQEAATTVGSAGMAVDVTEAEEAEGTLARTRRSHTETLNQLATAVAAFDANHKLTHWNNAFRQLWNLDAAFLERGPSNNAVMERLRADGSLPESPHWREWLEKTMDEVYRATEPREYEWFPPDGRSIRVIAAPQEGGGVTWLFENVSERVALQSRATELQRTRDASLESLGEGVAVFGPDGRLRLANPAFGAMWELPDDKREAGTHVSAIASACTDRFEIPSRLWADLVERITAFSEQREATSGQVRLKGDRTLSWSAQPLPSGQTMLTFVDVSDSVRVAEALQARTEAVEAADRMKSDFLGHVSYALRSPLTNIIGFTDLMTSGATGEVSEKQHEYLNHIGSSSGELLGTVNQIIDLTAVDAGELRLERAEIEVDRLILAAADSIAQRLEDHDLVLDVRADPDIGTMNADMDRAVQVLHNVLLNAVNHTPDGGTITLTATREPTEDGTELVFDIADEGPGIPEGIADNVFEPFTQHKGKGRHRGTGLGLSLVRALVALHGGSVALKTGPDGTTITCRFPTEQRDGEGPGSVLRAEPLQTALSDPQATSSGTGNGSLGMQAVASADDASDAGMRAQRRAAGR